MAPPRYADVDLGYQLTRHAEAVAARRKIEISWIERALVEPDWREADKVKPGLMHAFVRIAERYDRVLRVVYNPTVHPVRVVTVYFDRRMRGRL